jgi:hypothetical protein
MLNIQHLWQAISEMESAQGMPIEEFERWFRRESRNVHAWGEAQLIQAVLSVEAVLSEYRFGDLDEDATQKELAVAVRPFLTVHRVRAVNSIDVEPAGHAGWGKGQTNAGLGSSDATPVAA